MLRLNFSSLSPYEILKVVSAEISNGKEEWKISILTFLEQWADDSVQEIKVFTSGSTGKPKQITHTKDAMRASAEITIEALHLQRNTEALLCLPANKIAGMMMLVRSIEAGMNLTCIKPDTVPSKHIGNTHFDFAAFTAMQFNGSIQTEAGLNAMKRISKIIMGGEQIRMSDVELISKMPNEVYSTFGMTETISHIALKKLSGKKQDKHYHVLQGVSVAADEKSCLVIDAPALNVHHLATNDVVEIISKQEFDWLGRNDFVINSGGVKIHPEVVERKIADGFRGDFFVTGREDAETGEHVAVVLAMNAGYTTDFEKLQEALFALDPFELPREILLADKFEYAGNGKLKRVASLAHVVKSIPLE